MPTYVPIVSQSFDYSCGSASLASCLVYWEVWFGVEADLHPSLGTCSTGTSGAAIMRVARDLGLQVQYKTNLTMQDLDTMLAEGWTLILSIQAWGDYPFGTDFGSIWDDGHYVVLVNLINNHIQLMDPVLDGEYALMFGDDFEARWHDWSDDGSCREYHTAILLRGIIE